MVTEGMYVILVEQALFLVGAAGALLMHCEQACVRMDADLECLENGPLYFSVLYGVSLLASVGAFVGLVGSVVMTALVPGSLSLSLALLCARTRCAVLLRAALCSPRCAVLPRAALCSLALRCVPSRSSVLPRSYTRAPLQAN